MKQSHNWIWFFAALVVLGSGAIAINWAYNARQQLTMEQLAAAEDLWDKVGPTNYDLVVDKTFQSGNGTQPEQDLIKVKVRKKTVVEATFNGRPLPARLWDKNDMPAWFGFIETFLKDDTAPGAPRTYRTAEFDPHTGQLLRFTRSVSSTGERQELIFHLIPVS